MSPHILGGNFSIPIVNSMTLRTLDVWMIPFFCFSRSPAIPNGFGSRMTRKYELIWLFPSENRFFPWTRDILCTTIGIFFFLQKPLAHSVLCSLFLIATCAITRIEHNFMPNFEWWCSKRINQQSQSGFTLMAFVSSKFLVRTTRASTAYFCQWFCEKNAKKHGAV